MNYLQYRTLFNTPTRTFKDNIKVFLIDIKITIWAYLTGATVSYPKEFKPL